jgi:hypothetical protein
MCSHLFGGTGFLGLGHGGWVKAAEDIGGIAASAFLGPEIGGALGIGTAAGSALVGAGAGALTTGVQGGNPLLGAVEGGGAALIGGEVSDVLGGSGSLLTDAASGIGTVASDVGSVFSDTAAPAVSAGVDTAAASATDAATALGTTPLAVAGDTAASAAPIAGIAGSSPVDLTAASGALGVAPDTGAPIFSPGGGAADAPLFSPAPGGSDPLFVGANNAASGIGAVPGSGDTTFTQGTGAAPGQAIGVNPDTGQPIFAPSGSPSLVQNITSAVSPVASAVSGSGDGTGILGTGISPGQGLAAGVAAAGLGYNLLQKNSIPGLSQIENLASTSASQGQILQKYLQTGTLPPAVQQSIDAATKSGITAIKAKYASMGVAPGSSDEVQAIAQLQQQAVIQGATLADQLLSQGISESQLSGTLYNDLVSANTALNTQTGQAISALAGALAGGGTTIKLAA